MISKRGNYDFIIICIKQVGYMGNERKWGLRLGKIPNNERSKRIIWENKDTEVLIRTYRVILILFQKS